MGYDLYESRGNRKYRLQQYAEEKSIAPISSPTYSHWHKILNVLRSRTNTMQLRNQICLMESLLVHADRDIELPVHAVSGLAKLLFKIEKFARSILNKCKAAKRPPYIYYLPNPERTFKILCHLGWLNIKNVIQPPLKINGQLR